MNIRDSSFEENDVAMKIYLNGDTFDEQNIKKLNSLNKNTKEFEIIQMKLTKEMISNNKNVDPHLIQCIEDKICTFLESGEHHVMKIHFFFPKFSLASFFFSISKNIIPAKLAILVPLLVFVNLALKFVMLVTMLFIWILIFVFVIAWMFLIAISKRCWKIIKNFIFFFFYFIQIKMIFWILRKTIFSYKPKWFSKYRFH